MTASVTFHAETFVSLSPVGCTVLGAPWLRDCRGNVGADGRRARQHPRYLRCAHLASITQRIQSRGHSPRTIFTGAPTLFVHPRREGVEALPYGVVGRHPHLTHVVLNPSVTARSAVTAPLSGEPIGRGVAHRRCPSHPRRPQPLSHGAKRRDSSPCRGAEGWVRRGVAAYNLSPYRASKHAKRTGLRTGPF